MSSDTLISRQAADAAVPGGAGGDRLLSAASLFLSDEDVRLCFDWLSAIAALRMAYGEQENPASFPPRVTARSEGVWLRCLAGISSGTPVMGMKIIAAAMDAGFASYLIALFDQRSANLLALMDGNSITGFRTAATTALAADMLAPTGAIRLAVIGSGFEAKNHVRALAATRPIAGLKVFSPNPDSRSAFIDSLSDLDIPMEAAACARDTLDDANVVLCAARSRDETPTLCGHWLTPGMTILSIGSTMPEQREVDVETVARADRIIADVVDEVAHDTGDMISAAGSGVSFEEKLFSLAQLVGGQAPGRNGPDEIILYKSVGAAIQDITVAGACFERAKGKGLGAIMPATIAPVRKWKQKS